MEIADLFKFIFSEAGAVVALSILFDGFVIWLYINERKDRREAWRTHNEHVESTNAILGDLLRALEIIKERIK